MLALGGGLLPIAAAGGGTPVELLTLTGSSVADTMVSVDLLVSVTGVEVLGRRGCSPDAFSPPVPDLDGVLGSLEPLLPELGFFSTLLVFCLPFDGRCCFGVSLPSADLDHNESPWAQVEVDADGAASSRTDWRCCFV